MLDVLVTGGTVYDGSGTAGRRADVGVGGDRVAVVGDMPGERKAGDVIDAAGMAVAPALQPAGPSPRLRLFCSFPPPLATQPRWLRPWRRRSELRLYRTGAKTTNKVPLEDQEQDDNRKTAKNAHGHYLVPLIVVLAHQQF